MSAPKDASFDLFELMVALLLGLGALGSAWAAYQGGLWGGNSSTAYGAAATQATEASTAFNYGVTHIVRDLALDVDAKRSIVEGLYAKDRAARERAFVVASYLYAQQMSPEAYQVLGLPAKYRTEEGRAGELHMPPEVLAASLKVELGDDQAYVAQVLEAGTQGFAAAAQDFAEGRRANGLGDRFGLIGVLFAVGLFLAGVALVFKSRVRWAFATLSFAVLIASTAYLYVVPWAGGAPAAETAPAAESVDAAP